MSDRNNQSKDPAHEEVRLIFPVDQTEEPDRGGNELFSVRDAKKEDAHLHEPILAGLDPQTETELARENARARGLTEEQTRTLLNEPEPQPPAEPE